MKGGKRSEMKRNLILLTSVALILLMSVSILAFEWPWQTTGKATAGGTTKTVKVYEGKLKTFTIDNTKSNISLDFISAYEVILTVNGETSSKITKGKTIENIGGFDIKVNTIKYSSRSRTRNYAVVQIKKTEKKCIDSSGVKKMISLSGLVTGDSSIVYNAVSGVNEGFIVSHSGTEESYYLKATLSIDPETSIDLTTISNKLTGNEVCTDIRRGDTCTIGNVVLTIWDTEYINDTQKLVTLAANEGSSFDKLYAII